MTTKPKPKLRALMSMPTAARYLGFSVRHFRRLAEEQKIPVVVIGRSFFIRSGDLLNIKSGIVRVKAGEKHHHWDRSRVGPRSMF